MKKALDLQPDFLFATLMLANLSVDQGEIAKAREYVQKALSVESNNPSGLSVSGIVELFAENYSAASELFRRGLGRTVRLGDFSFRTNATGLGFSLLKLGQHAEGMKFLAESRARHEKSIERGNETAIIRYELAVISIAEGKQSEAYDWLLKAINLGWRDYRFARRDPMLASLRNDEQFTRIISDMKAKIEEQAKLVHQMENQ